MLKTNFQIPDGYVLVQAGTVRKIPIWKQLIIWYGGLMAIAFPVVVVIGAIKTIGTNLHH